jgi:hypothetical protein
MLTFAFPPALRRRRLALGGALFLAFDALMMGVGVAVVTRGEHLGAAAALAALGAGVSMLLAWALVRPPKARLVGGALRIEAAHRHFVLDREALREASIVELDLATVPEENLPKPLLKRTWWSPGDAMGWQIDGRGEPVFCAVTQLGPALRIESGIGALLWTPNDPAAVARALRETAGPR